MSDTAHPYSLIRHTTGPAAYVSGVLPYRSDGSLAEEPDEAITAVLATLRGRLESEGLGLADVAKTTVFLTDMAWLPKLNEAWHEAFSEPRPARSTIQVSALPRGAHIEVEAILEIPAS